MLYSTALVSCRTLQVVVTTILFVCFSVCDYGLLLLEKPHVSDINERERELSENGDSGLCVQQFSSVGQR